MRLPSCDGGTGKSAAETYFAEQEGRVLHPFRTLKYVEPLDADFRARTYLKGWGPRLS